MSKRKTRKAVSSSPRPEAQGGSSPLQPVDLPVRPSGFLGFPRGFWTLVLVAAAVRMAVLVQEGYWADEVYGYYDCFRPLEEKLRRTHFAHFIPGRFFLHLWDSVGALRLMVALWAVATFPFFHDWVKRLTGGFGAILATALLAVSAYHFNYSVDANYYAPVIFFSTLGLWFAMRYLDTAHPLDFFGAPASFGAGFFFHPFLGVLGATVSGLLLVRMLVEGRRRRALWPPSWWASGRKVGGAALALVEVVVLAGFLLFVIPKVKPFFFRILDWIELGATPRNYRFWPTLFFDFFRGYLADYPLSSRLGVSFAWAMVAMAGVGAVVSFRSRMWTGLLLFAPVLVSFVLIANLRAQHHFYVRYFSYLYPILMVYLVWGVLGLAGLANREPETQPSRETPELEAEGESASPSSPPLSSSPRAPWAAWAVLAVYGLGIVLAVRFGWTRPGVGQWLAWGIGGALLLAFAAPIRDRLPRGPVLAACLFISFVFAVNTATLVHRFLVRGGGNWHRVAAHLKEHARPGDLILYEYPQEGRMLQYYLPRIGLSFDDTLQLPIADTYSEIRMALVQGLARNDSSFWLVRGWNINQRPLLTQWAVAHLPLVVDAPSNFEPFLDVFLFHGNRKDRYLQNAYGVRMQYAPTEEQPSASAVAPDGAAIRRWERTAVVQNPTSVSLRLTNPASFPPDARIRPVIDDVAGTWRAAQDPSPPLSVPRGKVRMGVEIAVGASGATSTAAESAPLPEVLWSALDLPAGAWFPARDVTVPFPTFCHADTHDAKKALQLSRNLGVQYWIDFPTPGTYQLELEAVHDKGHWDVERPVWVDVSLDGEFQGILSFDRQDNQWDTKAMPLEIPQPGLHELAIHLVSAGPAEWNLPSDKETTLIYSGFALRRLEKGESPRDHRAQFSLATSRKPTTRAVVVVDEAATPSPTPLPGWTVLGQPGVVAYAPDRSVGARRLPAVEIEVPHDSPGVLLLAPRYETAPGHLVQVEALLETFDLKNHSVTLGLAFFAEGQSEMLPSSNLFAQEAMFRTSNHTRFSAQGIAPPTATHYAPVINIFPNGRQPATRSGWVRIARASVGQSPADARTRSENE